MNYNQKLIKQFKNKIKSINDLFELKKQRNNFQYIIFNLKTNKNQVNLLYETEISLNNNIKLFEKYKNIIEKKISNITNNDKILNHNNYTFKNKTNKKDKTNKTQKIKY